MNFIIYIFYINFTLIYSYLANAHYHESIKLDNGNFIIFSCKGQFTLDPAFKILYNITNNVIGNDKTYDRVKQFSKEEGGYILYITDTNHYILNSYGNLLTSRSISKSIYNHYYSVIPYNLLINRLNYYIIHFNNSQIVFIKHSYYINNNNSGYFSEASYIINGYTNNLITCQLMKYSNEKVISCFFLTYLNDEYFINCTVFKSEDNFEVFRSSQIKIEASSFYRLESEVLLDKERQKTLVMLYITYNNKNCLFYGGYDIHNNNFTYGYLIEDNCNLYYEYNYDFGISYFKETEEFIVSALSQCTFNNISQNSYLIYSFDNNFEYSFFGKLSDLVLGDTYCNNEAFTIYKNSFHSILFSSDTQKYCIILNVNDSNIISFFVINKDIHIINPIELKSSDSPIEYICEKYSIFNDINCTNSVSLIDNFKRLSENKYLEKCTSEINYITSNFTCGNYNYKTFEFSFNCSEKYPYEIVNAHKCVEYCDENDLSSGICILNYYDSNSNNITENIIDTNSYEVKINQSYIISNEIYYKDIKTYSKDTILETRNIQSDSNINSKDIILEISNIESDNNINSKDINLETSNIESDNNINSKDTILETRNIEPDNSISSDTDYSTINNLIKSAEQKIYDLLDEFFNMKKDKNINLIENIFSGSSINIILDNIINGDNDIIISNNETIIQITSTDNQRNNKNNNISTINFRECEETLKSIYNISPNKSLLILKIDSFIAGSNIPVIQYEVYHPDNKSKLDLSLCDNKIEINIPVLIDENNLYKYEPESDYYNDRCFTNTSDDENDKPLEYRRKEFANNNMSLCESECDYKGYDYETKNSICECEIKNEISIFNIKIDTERLYNKFTGLTSSNIDIIKCYYLLFKKENLIYNIGFYVILFIIIIFCIGAIIFIFKGYNILVKKIDIIIKTNHRLSGKPLKSKNNMNKNRKSIKKKSAKRKKKKSKSKKKNNPPIKKVKNRNKSRKESNIRYDLSKEAKSTQKLNYKNNESLVKNINNEKVKTSKGIKRKKRNINTINKSKLVTDIPYSKNNYINKPKVFFNDYELNRLQYKEAIKYDKRTYIQYYWSLLKKGNLFLFSFMPNNDYNSMIIKICLFFFSFGLYYTVNALFFTDSTMYKIYEEKGEYDFIYQIPKILYSNLICTVINLIVRILSLSEKDILNIKIMRGEENLEKKVKSIKNCLKIKFFFYYLISFIFLFIFLFYTSCFCAVYRNTQLYLIKDTLISFSLSLLYPLGYYLIPGVFRLPALRNKNKNKNCIYKISLLLQSL